MNISKIVVRAAPVLIGLPILLSRPSGWFRPGYTRIGTGAKIIDRCL